MSDELIARSQDLSQLEADGYGVRVVDGALVVGQIPFLDAAGAVQWGCLLSSLDLAGDITAPPGNHDVYFAGGTPHDANGTPLQITIGGGQPMAGMQADHRLSTKPRSGRYDDYHHKMATYATLISAPAEQVDPTATARSLPVTPDDSDSPFVYHDTASARVGLDTTVFAGLRIGVIGAGGTGVHVVDHVTKTAVAEIHVWDGDVLLQHNAFRAPGAVPLDDLRRRPNKAVYWADRYAAIHSGVHGHGYRINEGNVDELADLDYAFVCVDDGESRALLIDCLREAGISFIDTGMGLRRVGNQIAGLVRTTAVTQDRPGGVDHVPTGSGGDDQEYEDNIQLGDLNALNAVLAVIQWKKLVGFYYDDSEVLHVVYNLAGNEIMHGDAA